LVGRTQSRVRVPSGAYGTHTTEGPDLVFTEGTESAGTRGGETFIDVSTGSIRLYIESTGTGTVAHPSCDGDAFSSCRTVALVLTAGEHTGLSILGVGRLAPTVWTIAGAALDERISIVASWTLTVKAAGQILAECIDSTSWLSSRTQGAFIDISTEAGRFTLEASLTDAFSLRTQFSCGTWSAC
jgi:hypothetical protein